MRDRTPDIDVVPIRHGALTTHWAVLADGRHIAIVGERKDAVWIAFQLAYHSGWMDDDPPAPPVDRQAD
jgi:hypothetical protein